MTIGVIDYGVGNLRSIANALAEIDIPAIVSSDPIRLENCDRYILPGVGAFPFGMAALRERGLDRLVTSCGQTGKPLLGICLGMQLLGEYSSEFQITKGLALVEGVADRLKQPAAGAGDENKLRLPHVGWLKVKSTDRARGFAARLMDRMNLAATYYFVHSYALPPHASNTVATSCYGKIEFAAMVAHENIVGTQFHPEKSGPQGLKFLDDFCRLETE